MTITKDFVTDYSADPTGTNDNCPPLANFSAFGATLGTTPVILTVSAGTYLLEGLTDGFQAQFFAKPIYNYTLSGHSSADTIWKIPQVNSFAPLFSGGLGEGSTAFRIASVGAGNTTLTLLTPSDGTGLTVGGWVQILGLDLQGTVEGNFGFPINNHFFDYAKVVSVNTTTGAVVIDRPLTDSYKSTWAIQYDGVTGGAGLPQGGAAYIYPMDPSFEKTVLVQNMQFQLPNDSTGWFYSANATSITVQNCIFTGTGGPVPSQNVSVTWQGCDLTNGLIEVDKIIQDFYIDTCTHTAVGNSKIFIQSSSIKNLHVTNSHLHWIAGTGRNTSIDSSTIDKLWLGTAAYGASKQLNLTNSTVSELLTAGGPVYSIAGLRWSGNVVRTRRKIPVSGMATSPGGLVRLTVDTTAELDSGMTLNYSGLFTNLQGQGTITVVDSTHVDLPNNASTGGNGGVPVVWTGGGSLNNYAQSWAIPGYFVDLRSSVNGVGILGNFQVLDQWNDANYIYVSCSISGWPANTSSFSTNPMPIVYASNNVGCPEALEISLPGAQGKPLWSYSNRTYDHTLGTAANGPSPTNIGKINSIKVNVQTPYTGVQSSLVFHLSAFDNWQALHADGSVFSLALSVNCKIAGTRTVTPTGNTGLQSGDSLPTLAAGDRLGGQSFSSPAFNVDVSSETGVGPIVNLEIATDQGISFVPVAVVPLGLRLHA